MNTVLRVCARRVSQGLRNLRELGLTRRAAPHHVTSDAKHWGIGHRTTRGDMHVSSLAQGHPLPYY